MSLSTLVVSFLQEAGLFPPGRGKVKRLNRFLLIPTSIYAKVNLIPSSPCCGRH